MLLVTKRTFFIHQTLYVNIHPQIVYNNARKEKKKKGEMKA